MKNTPSPLSLLSIFFVGSASLPAAATFTDDLTSLSSNLEIADTVGTDNTISFSASGATFSNVAGNDSRNYIRTVDTDYGTGSYMAEVTWNGLGAAFIGFGGGNVGTFGTPDWDIADSLWMEFSGSSDDGPVQGTNPGRFSSNLGPMDNPVIGENPSEPVRFRMIYLAEDNTIQFFADNNYNGSFSADAQTAALDLADLGGGANFFADPSDETRFYFGGGSFGVNGPTFSDFSVSSIPEPNAFALLGGCFALGFLTVRRR
ncbi:MAG: hypothetical protein ACQKBT_00085 [Puniceicoccales bacterium]